VFKTLIPTEELVRIHEKTKRKDKKRTFNEAKKGYGITEDRRKDILKRIFEIENLK